MATRLYFRNTTAAEPKPNVRYSAPTPAYNANHYLTSTLGGGQDTSGAIYPCEMLVAIGASNATITKTITEPGIAHNGWVKAFISPSLAAQTISGTFSLVADFAEGNNLQNMNPMIYIYVWKADDSGQRGNLYGTAAVPIVSTLEADTTQGTLQTFTFTSYTLASLAISAGDRIVIEVSFYDNNTRTNSYAHGFGLNGAASSGYESYIEFSMNLSWNLATYSVTRTSDARFKKTQLTTKTSDARFLKSQQTTKTSDARFFKTQTATKTSDARFLKTQSMTTSSNARFLKSQSLTRTSDSRFLKAISLTITSDAEFKASVTPRFLYTSSDARFLKSQSLAKTSDARFLKSQSITRTSDTRFFKTQAAFINSDARFRRTSTIDMTSDALFKGGIIHGYIYRTSDARFQKRMGFTISSNAIFIAPAVLLTDFREWLGLSITILNDASMAACMKMANNYCLAYCQAQGVPVGGQGYSFAIRYMTAANIWRNLDARGIKPPALAASSLRISSDTGQAIAQWTAMALNALEMTVKTNAPIRRDLYSRHLRSGKA